MSTERRIDTPAGRVRVRGMPAAVEAAVRLVGAHAPRERTICEPLPVGDQRLFAKGGALRGRAAWRHALRRWCLRAPAPRVREYENLRWLSARVFQVPWPLAAAVLWRGGRPRYQLLLTQELPDARPFLETGTAPGLLEELGGEVARMHALGFVHRDLFLRNLLVLPPERHRRLVFLDAWRAAPNASWRGPAYDLACLLLDGADRWSREEQRTLLEAYTRGRRVQERPAARGLLRRVEQEREGLLRRLRREPARLRGGAMPGAWSATGLSIDG